MSNGSHRRPCNSEQYRANFDRIQWSRRDDARSGRIVIGARGSRGHAASCGEIVSVNAGVGDTQIAEANRMMQVAGLDVRFDTQGMHAPNRQQYLKALRLRGLHNNDEIRGGVSRSDN